MPISIHALLAESDFRQNYECFEWIIFLSTLSLRRATGILSTLIIGFSEFLSTLSLRRATILHMAHLMELLFLSTLSLRRATNIPNFTREVKPNFYPRSPCGERRYWPCVHVVGCPISIHALLAESDRAPPYNLMIQQKISIHALLAESDFLLTSCLFLLCRFLSTLSLRRATVPFVVLRFQQSNFYPRSPCGERHCL